MDYIVYLLAELDYVCLTTTDQFYNDVPTIQNLAVITLKTTDLGAARAKLSQLAELHNLVAYEFIPQPITHGTNRHHV